MGVMRKEVIYYYYIIPINFDYENDICLCAVTQGFIIKAVYLPIISISLSNRCYILLKVDASFAVNKFEIILSSRVCATDSSYYDIVGIRFRCQYIQIIDTFNMDLPFCNILDFKLIENARS